MILIEAKRIWFLKFLLDSCCGSMVVLKTTINVREGILHVGIQCINQFFTYLALLKKVCEAILDTIFYFLFDHRLQRLDSELSRTHSHFFTSESASLAKTSNLKFSFCLVQFNKKSMRNSKENFRLQSLHGHRVQKTIVTFKWRYKLCKLHFTSPYLQSGQLGVESSRGL